MFIKIFLFELRYRLKRPATYAYFAILFLFALISGIYGDGPSSEKAFVNSSYSIGQLLIVISIFQMLISSAVMGVPVYRDIEYKTKDYFFTYPIGEKAYLSGRYLGSFIILVFICLGVHIGYSIGVPIGSLTGEIEPERLGPFTLNHYVYNTLVFTLPNVFFTGTLFFALVGLTRNIMVTYVGSVILFIGYLLANALTSDLDNKDLVDILDPFALTTYINATKYWSPAEQNVALVPLEGNVLINRILWMSVSVAILMVTYFKFSFAGMLEVATGKRKKESESPAAAIRPLMELPLVTKVFSTSTYIRTLLRQAVLEFGNIVKDVYFISILLAGVLFLFLDGWFGFPIYGTPSLPATYYMLQVKDFNYIIFVFIIIIFYTGEVVHRDKSVFYANIADALPVPNWVSYGSKFLSLVMVSFVLVNLVLVCGLLNQVIKGFFDIDFSMYFTDLYLIEFPEYLQLTMLAFIVHILVNNKFMGHVVSIGIWVLMFSLRAFAELDYNLLFYSYAPSYTLSDMNRFGTYICSQSWFNFYWLSLGIVFMLLGVLFWNRGSETSFAVRLKIAQSRFSPAIGFALLFFMLCWVGAGSFIYYNVSVLNSYQSRKEGIRLGVDFEKKYKRYEFTAQPKIADAKVNIELFPSKRMVKAKGIFTVVNKSETPIDSLHMFFSGAETISRILKFNVNGNDLQAVKKDTVSKYYCFVPAAPLQPGDTAEMVVMVEGGSRGFSNSAAQGRIVANGTFVGLQIFPGFGYPGDLITSDKERKKHGLPKVEYTLPSQDDPRGLNNFLFTNDADWINFEAIVSTEEDEIAIAPGYLQREWVENGRRYFHYKMDNQIDLFANFSSAAYAVQRDKWTNGRDTVNIEIYHHPGHNYNNGRFIKSVQASLSYFSENFSPYQFRQMRILEFPRYASFAQSFPNTVPYSESFGWVGDFSDPDDTDYAFYVTSHEVAHQWWGHQVMPSATRGANQISESMAEYTALMVMKNEYGAESMQPFLKYSLDGYLRGRAGEGKFEATLLENDSRAYVWYQKGSLVLYALQDYIGEDRLNRAFREFVKAAAFRQAAPFATSNEWYSYITAAVPDSLKYFAEESFEKIALYENKAMEATYVSLPDSTFKVFLTVDTRKIYYDSAGNEAARPAMKNLIDIGVFSEDTKGEKGIRKKVPLYLEKKWLAPGKYTLELIVTQKPVKAGIDPYNKLIDRVPDDNLKSVSKK